MHKKTKNVSHALGPPKLTRRELLAGAATAAVAASIPAAFASGSKPARKKQMPRARSDMQVRRYMAASALLTDGRILIAGGYDRPWTESNAPKPMRSAVIYDPSSGTSVAVAPLSVPRARHAAVSLSDGKVAVVGGIGLTATATVEIYDPVANAWRFAKPLSQPRYDHSAVTDGSSIYVLGGSGQTMMSSIEVLDPSSQIEMTVRLGS